MELGTSDILREIYVELHDTRKKIDSIESKITPILNSGCKADAAINPERDSEYKYQDNQDKKLDWLKECFPNWEKSEVKILNRMKKHIAKHVKDSSPKLLDAGCGQGRLLPVFEPYFDLITAVEPDKERYYATKELIAEKGLGKKIDARNIKIQNLGDDIKYDAIICSHVLQHVSIQTFNEIIERFKSILKNSGLLFLTVSHSTIDHEYFEIVYTTCKENDWDVVSKQDFNNAERLDGVLPVRHFTIDDIKRYLKGFDIIDYRVFHVYPMLPLLETVINKFPTLQTLHGTDMFVAARLK